MAKVIKINRSSVTALAKSPSTNTNCSEKSIVSEIITNQLSANISDEQFEKRMAIIHQEFERPVFYTIEQVSKLTGVNVCTIQKLFNSVDFPSCDIGKQKFIEANALKEYFTVRRSKENMSKTDKVINLEITDDLDVTG